MTSSLQYSDFKILENKVSKIYSYTYNYTSFQIESFLKSRIKSEKPSENIYKSTFSIEDFLSNLTTTDISSTEASIISKDNLILTLQKGKHFTIDTNKSIVILKLPLINKISIGEVKENENLIDLLSGFSKKIVSIKININNQHEVFIDSKEDTNEVSDYLNSKSISHTIEEHVFKESLFSFGKKSISFKKSSNEKSIYSQHDQQDENNNYKIRSQSIYEHSLSQAHAKKNLPFNAFYSVKDIISCFNKLKNEELTCPSDWNENYHLDFMVKDRRKELEVLANNDDKPNRNRANTMNFTNKINMTSYYKTKNSILRHSAHKKS